MKKMQLNKEQLEAVSYTSGPLIIVAGAGTGKTKVVTEKINYIIKKKLAKPEEILALTFNEKAAEEMQERVDSILDFGYFDIQISTFHSFCQKLLEQYGLDIGISDRFKILTESNAWILIKKNINKFNLDYYKPLGSPMRHIQALIKHFSKCKDELISPKSYLNEINKKIKNKKNIEQEEINRLNELHNAYKVYNQLLLDNNYLDFGDLIYFSNILLEKRPNILHKLQNNYKFILIDEFQDVNKAQYELIKKIVGKNNQLTVVGDDDQSIYAFRGASVKNILNFKKDFLNAKEIVLKTNYRSEQNILDKAYQLIQNNNPERLEVKLKIDKKLISTQKKAKKSTVIHSHFRNLAEETDFIAQEILKLKNIEKNCNWDDFAILVRANNQANSFIDELEKNNIPYEFLAASGLFRQSIIIDCLSFFKLIDNYRESQAIFRLLNLKFLKINYKDLHNLLFYAKRKGISYYEALKRIEDTNIPKDKQLSFKKLLNIINESIKLIDNKKPSEILYNFFDKIGYLKYLLKEENNLNQEVIRQIKYLTQFFEYIKDYETMLSNNVSVHEFIEHIDQISDAGDSGIVTQPEDTFGSVKISTAHLSKGMEFKYVFIVNAIEDRFPAKNKGSGILLPSEVFLEKNNIEQKNVHLSEERRLFYVAMTRAKNKLYITSADNYGGVRTRKISRFLAEMDFQKIENISLQKLISSGELKEKIIISKKNEQKINIKSFSYTKLMQYEKCPYQFWLSNILNLPISEGNPYLSFGTSIHNTLEKFYSKLIELNDSNNQLRNKKSQTLNAPSVSELLEIYKKEWLDDWYLNEEQKISFYKKGEDMLSSFYYKNKNNWNIPLSLELKFKIKLGTYVINGRIDRLDKDLNGDLEIIDYKTGKAKEKINKEDKNQLLLYQMAIDEINKTNKLGEVKKLTYYYLENGTKLSFIGSDLEMDALKEKIILLIEQINKGNFKPNPKQDNCKYCDFNKICNFRVY